MNVLITGASSGIGAAVAREYAAAGAERLFLAGRNAPRLAAVAAACRAAGAQVATRILDVADASAVRDWLDACEAVAPVEIVFSNAGVGTGVEDAANVRRTFATNVDGNLNVVLPVIDLFRGPRARRRRQIVVTASIAGYAPLATCPAYAATKACMKSWGLSLRGMLAREGIRVNVLCPGFVRSRITDRNTCPMPFFMEADKAARIIRARVERNVGLIAFPWPMRLAVWFLSLLPWRVAEFVAGLLPAKNAGAREDRDAPEGIAF
ncbi:MAG: SDR family NAD(P)-dependent oxidoreductase [Kiritimatiellia bacterium]